MNVRPKEYFQLAPNMRTAYIELCIYLISKSVTYRPGRLRVLADRNQPTRFPRPRAKYLHIFGRRSTGEIRYAFGRRSTGEILYAFGRGRRSTRESIYLYLYIRVKGI